MQIPQYTREVIKERRVANTVNPQAIQQAGVAADLGAVIANKMQETAETTWLNETLVAKQKQATDMMYSERLNYTDNPQGYSGLFNKKLEELDVNLIKTAPTERAREAYKKSVLEQNAGIYQKNKDWEFGATVDRFKRGAEQSNQNTIDMARLQGKNGDEFDPDNYNQIDATVLSGANVLPQSQLDDYARAAKQKADQAYLEGLISSSPDRAKKLLDNGEYSAIPQAADFEYAVKSVFKEEGGYVPDDAGAGPTIYGVNSKANPKEFERIIALQNEGMVDEAKAVAKQTYKTKYWDSIGADNLPAQLAFVAMDSAVNQGVGATKQMLQEANGDIGKFLDLRRARYIETAKNPEKAPNLKGWLARVDRMEARLDGGLLPEDKIATLSSIASKQIDAIATETEAALKKQRAVDDSRIELAMAQISQVSDALPISDMIDQKQSEYGEAWANDMRTKLVKSSDEFVKKGRSIAMGSAFVSGEAVYNPSNSDHKKALDDFYTGYISSQEFQQMQPEERNVILSDMVRKAGAVPDALKGEVKRVSMSQDVEQITRVADMIDRITATNPHLLPQFGSDNDLRRIDMINDRINAGYQPKDAMATVDSILDPRNAPAQEQIKIELQAWKKANPTYYADQVDKAFNPWFGSLNQNAVAKSSIDAAAAEFRVRWEDAYMKTRDVDQATKEANRMLSDWGVSAVNPNNMVMKFSPEKYYNIENQKPDWIRKQAIDDALELNKNEWVQYSKEDLEKNLYIVSDPNITPRTAATGAPQYKLMLLKDGVVYPLSENPWMPDKQKETKNIVDLAVEEKNIEKYDRAKFFGGNLKDKAYIDIQNKEKADKQKEVSDFWGNK